MSSSQAIGGAATGLGAELVTRRQPLTGVRGFFHRLRKTRFTVA